MSKLVYYGSDGVKVRIMTRRLQKCLDVSTFLTFHHPLFSLRMLAVCRRLTGCQSYESYEVVDTTKFNRKSTHSRERCGWRQKQCTEMIYIHTAHHYMYDFW